MESQCGHYKAEDGTCLIDELICAEVECPHGNYKHPDPEDQGDPFEHSKCVIVEGDDFIGFQCTMPEWV